SIEELNQSFGVCNGQFDNDRVTLFLRSEPENPLYMMQNGSYSIVDQKNLYEKYESEFEEGEGEGVLDPQQIEEDLFNRIGKRIIYDEKDELQENDSSCGNTCFFHILDRLQVNWIDGYMLIEVERSNIGEEFFIPR
ncbi:hypothetical protein Goklo_025445, partial [Gossypium klotzschianum]|nr:hypothetical protein [Gossypium klotzschianum]